MKAGALRKRVDIEEATEVVDGFGDVVQTWAAIASDLPAAVIPVRGKELNKNQQTTAELSHRVTVRFSPDVWQVDTKCRIKYGTRYFDIKSAMSPGREFRELVFECVENVTYG